MLIFCARPSTLISFRRPRVFRSCLNGLMLCSRQIEESNLRAVQNGTAFQRRVIAICQDEKERAHAQTSILRAVSYLWFRDQEELCAAFRYSALKNSRRPEVCRH